MRRQRSRCSRLTVPYALADKRTMCIMGDCCGKLHSLNTSCICGPRLTSRGLDLAAKAYCTQLHWLTSLRHMKARLLRPKAERHREARELQELIGRSSCTPNPAQPHNPMKIA